MTVLDAEGTGAQTCAIMFPIRDHNPSGRTPFVTWALLAANVLLFLLYWLGQSEAGIARVFWEWGMVPARLSAGDGYATLVSSMFLHGGWMHLIGNMLFLWIFGDNLEDVMGHAGFAVFYLLGGVAAGLMQYAVDPQSTVPVVGASGAIAAVMGGYLLLFPKARVDILLIIVIFFRVFTVPAWTMLAVWFGLQLFYGLIEQRAEGGVAYWAHAGGFVAGLVLALPAWLRLGAMRFWARNAGHPPHPDAVYAPSRVPQVTRRR